MHDVKVPSVNIGVVGHVDHGKTTLVNALTGTWTDRHSEEVKRGISIRLGYADATFYRCEKCEGTDAFSTSPDCPVCGGKGTPFRSISFVDAPGHETLMATMLSGSALMDGAMLVIAASEKCPQPQTKEHLMALELVGIKNIVIVQSKIDVVSQKEAIDNYHEIKKFIKGTIAENSQIIPVSSQKGINIGALVQALDLTIPEPVRDPNAEPVMLIARSFDVNKPGCNWKDSIVYRLDLSDIMKSIGNNSIFIGVLIGNWDKGGHIVSLRLKYFDEPEYENRIKWIPITTKVTSINAGSSKVTEATPGGLLGVGTKLDPALTKSDALAGQVLGHEGKLPPVWDKIRCRVTLMERVVGATSELVIEPLKHSEPLMLSVGTAVTVGVVSNTKKDTVEIQLKRPVCAELGSRIAISRQVGARWRLIGMGVLSE